MASTDLLFEFPPSSGSPVNLVFGEDAPPPPVSDAHVTGNITLVRPTLSGGVRLGIRLAGVGVLVRPTWSGAVTYYTDTRRPVVSTVASPFQDAGARESSTAAVFQDARSLNTGADPSWQDAARVQAPLAPRFEDGSTVRRGGDVRFQDAARLRGSAEPRFQDGTTVRRGGDVRFQDATRVPRWATSPRFQDGDQGPRNWAAVRFQDGIPYSVLIGARNGRGRFVEVGAGDVRYQDAMRPPPGISWWPPQPPEPDPCYTPSPHLVFQFPWAADTNLVFWCENHDEPPGPQPGVVVPIRKVYLVVNSATLIRVSDGKPIPAKAMSLSLDVDSWTWSFSASVPSTAFPDIAWQSGQPVEVQATVNGTPFRFLVESIARERTFLGDELRVSGRGRSALLDTPYAPAMSFFAEDTLTSQQLMDWVLTDNGVPLGWDVDWNLTAWSVPGGVFAHQGSYIGALNRIAEAAGGYLQPHDTADEIIVLPRYPVAPWDWGDVEPDFELPSAVVQREGTEWINKPRYNRVYVSGESVGVLGRVTRAGTAGDMLAPGVVDPLITHVDAARQRGTAILSDVGRIANVSLRLPVLPETGIIRPGQFIKYVDGASERIGLARGVQVQVQLPAIWQQITVETHDEPV